MSHPNRQSPGKSQREGSKSRRHHEKRRRAKDRRRRREADEMGRDAHNSCGRKCRYPHELAATRVALQAMRKGAPPLWVYPCRFCGGWHLTSHPRWDGTES